jgi:DNA-binding IscR family transcriptional regulator
MFKVRNAIADVLDTISLTDVVQNAIDHTVCAADILD